jgi:radical SAM protein with 4Fe4S-binding SPASM domain
MISKFYKAIKALVTRQVTIECDRIPYEFKKVPFKKILNWILVEASALIKPEQPWGWPTHFQIEPTNRCNLSCALCPISGDMDRPTGHMDLTLFKKLIDETGDYIFLIILWDWGEPFVSPCIYDMISYARNKGIKVVSSTNVHVFVNEENADKLILSGIDSIIVSMDGITQETYSRYRRGGSLESALKGIRTIVARKQALNSETPLINLRFIPMRHNEHEIPKLKDMARSLGVDALTFKTLNPYSSDTNGSKATEKKEGWREFLPENPLYRRFKYSADRQSRLRRTSNPCRQLWNNPVVHWDGKVCPCTYDYRDKYFLGDLKKDTLKNIWFGDAYRGIRRRFRADWEDIPLCKECSYAYEGGSCIDETIAEAFFYK